MYAYFTLITSAAGLWIDKNLIVIVGDVSSYKLYNFISDDDTNEFLDIWTDDDWNTGFDHVLVIFNRAVSFRRENPLNDVTFFRKSASLLMDFVPNWSENLLTDLIYPWLYLNMIFIE
jgi:hypothetical protein